MVPIGRLVEEGGVGREVYDANGVTRIVAVKNNGTKPVWRVRLRNGNFVEATPDHVVKAARARRTQPEMAARRRTPGWHAYAPASASGEGQPGRSRRPARLVAVGSGGSTGLLTDEPMGEVDATNLARAEAALAGWLQADGFVGQYDHGTNKSLTIEFQVANDDEYQWVMDNLEVALSTGAFQGQGRRR